MTREFFTPKRNRWIAACIHFHERVDVAIEFLLHGTVQIPANGIEEG
jgi:hypothetical protein